MDPKKGYPVGMIFGHGLTLLLLSKKAVGAGFESSILLFSKVFQKNELAYKRINRSTCYQIYVVVSQKKI